ncbi:ABC transporter ATP-binding protein [Leptolyngbya sp. BC1307]|uniref:ABC transporter ATP-binding protein n=1 Tax=Leptolyngbya sp. BC1307 TaxID=2029589 RepID=UPI000EFDA626|nr:ABC transporter ATP-binding protein [Leptolyngbya sp. BC1307]
MTILKFEQVTMRAAAGPVEILKDLSFAVEPGDFVALVGPSGSGKTSLLRLINRLSEVSRGTIWFAGQDIQQLPVVSLRRQIALVNQESRLLGMNVKTALGYPLRLQGRPTAEIAAAVNQWAERLNIPADWMDRTAVNLSLGQRQRVAIARALLSEPKILLLDEPTSSQDVGYSEFLLARLADWATQGKLTIIMANHQIDLAARYVNRLWHLNDGRLIADLPADAVDWGQLRQSLVAAEQQAQADWS